MKTEKIADHPGITVSLTKPSFWVSILFAFCLLSSDVFGYQNNLPESKSVFRYLNKIRAQAGMTLFTWNSILQKSSNNHAVYITENAIISHLEFTGKPYYTGETPGDRALAEGYDLRNVTENFSRGGDNPLESVDGLMSAIYHRFGFLDFSKNEIGIAMVKANDGFNVVYNMGNAQLNKLCRLAVQKESGKYYQNLCKNTPIILAERVDELERETSKKNKAVVTWPPKNADQIDPAFYEEIPDPLPNLSVSGYPISVQFNPAYYDNVKLVTFELYEIDQHGLKLVKPVHLMHRRNDPNNKFTDNQFALFPLNRLKWGTGYQVYVKYKHNDLVHSVDWQFQTKKLEYPQFTIQANGDYLMVEELKKYAVYIPPTKRYPYSERLSVESPYSVQVDINWEDRNTLLMKLQGQHCQPVVFYLDGQRSFSVVLSNRDNIKDHIQNLKRTQNLCR